jgi:hypothetical protein
VTNIGARENEQSDPGDETTWINRLQVEYGDVGLGIGTGSPRLSWTIDTSDDRWESDSYEVELSVEGEPMTRAVITSSDQVLVPWPFAPLPSRTQSSVRVRVGSGSVFTGFSRSQAWEIGLLDAADWSAEFISPSSLGGLDDGAPIVFDLVELPSAPIRARLYVTAHGLYEFSINGQRVGDDVLTPWVDQLRASSPPSDLRRDLAPDFRTESAVWPAGKRMVSRPTGLAGQSIELRRSTCASCPART